MKVVHVFKDFDPPLRAGITRYVADIADAMAERGHRVEVHVAGVRHHRRDRLPSGVLVHRHRELARALSMPIAAGLVSEVRSVDADILHLHLPNPIGELGAVCNRVSPIVCTFHAQLGRQRALEPWYAPLRSRLLGRSRRIFVSAPAMAAVPELVEHQDRVVVLPYGVSPRLATPNGLPRPTSRNQPHSSDSESLRLLFVGRLVYYKGVDVLLHAVASVPSAKLHVVGDGPERARLESRAAGLGLGERVRFSGSVPDHDLLDAFAAADVFVLPSVSRAEAFGLAMAEAMASGLPAISTSLATATDWVNVNDLTGLVVQSGSAEALARAIERLTDRELRARLGRGARDRAERLFSFASHVDGVERAYEEAATWASS